MVNALQFRNDLGYQAVLPSINIYFLAVIAQALNIVPGRKISKTLIDEITGKKLVNPTKTLRTLTELRPGGTYKPLSLNKITNMTHFCSALHLF